MGIWSARQKIHEVLADQPELFRSTHERLRKIGFDIVIKLDEAKELRDPALTRWQHFKAAVGWRL